MFKLNMIGIDVAGKEPKRLGLVKGEKGHSSFTSPSQTGGIPYGHATLQRLFYMNKLKTFFHGKWNLGFTKNKIPTAIGFQSFFGTLMSHGVSCSSDEEEKYTDSDYFWDLVKENLPYTVSLIVIVLVSKYYKIIGKKIFALFFIISLCAVFAIRMHCWSLSYNPSSCIFMENNVIQEQPYKDDKITLRITDQAVRFMKYRAKAVQPFLYVMSFMQPKFPSARSYMFRNRTGGGAYSDAVHEMDWSVGKILKALEEMQLHENTLVIFLSDNSPSCVHPVHGEPLKEHQCGKSELTLNDGTKVKLKGEQGSNFEGGLRVPAIIRFPGKTKPNTVTDVVASVMDVYGTVLDVFKFHKEHTEKYIDGISLIPVMENPKLKPSNTIHDRLYHYCDTKEISAVTVGNLKFHLRNGTSTDCSGPLLKIPLLYNISGDPGETTPLPVKDYAQLLYHIKASIKKYEITSDIVKVTSQFDEKPNFLHFPCVDLPCVKEYNVKEDFNSIIYN